MELKELLGLGPPGFDILVLEFTKHEQTLKIFYTIVILRRNVPAVLDCTGAVSRPTSFIKSMYRWLCYVLLLSQFCFQQFSKS